MPPDMAISMRHTKLKREEAAMLAGEVNKPSWESRNEGIHERVSFEDSIWGFDLAGGSFYKTPLRVTYVKPGSRASKAGIRPGDQLKRINDIETSTLTIQEAHEIIIESGIHLKLAVTAPEDEEDAYYCYQDPVDTSGYDSEEERRKEAEREKKRQVHAKVSSYWSLQWPWVSKRRLIYRESNCFMVPSKYENQHKEKFPPVPVLRYTDDVIADSLKDLKLKDTVETLVKNLSSVKDVNESNELINGSQEPVQNKPNETVTKGAESIKETIANDVQNITNGAESIKETIANDVQNITNGAESIKETIANDDENTVQPNIDDDTKYMASSDSDEKESDIENKDVNGNLDNIPDDEEEKNVQPLEAEEDSIQEISESDSANLEEVKTKPVVDLPNESNGDVGPKDDELLEEMLNSETDVSEIENEKIIDSILSESEDTADER